MDLVSRRFSKRQAAATATIASRDSQRVIARLERRASLNVVGESAHPPSGCKRAAVGSQNLSSSFSGSSFPEQVGRSQEVAGVDDSRRALGRGAARNRKR